MKKFLLTLLTVITGITLFAQSQGPNDPGTAAGAPPSQCLACPGSDFYNIPNILLLDNNTADVSLEPNAFCFQSSCYRSRYLVASNFGFNIPGTATITGISADIYGQAGNVNSAADSTVKLIQNTVPTGANRAISTAWPIIGAYAAHGSSTDLWGLTWVPADINDPAFGLYLKVYNMDPNASTTASVDHIRITVYYSTTTGTYSQTSSSSTLNAYQNDNELNVAFSCNEQITNGSLKIFNLMGEVQIKKELKNVPAGANNEKFAIENLAPGIYFVQFDNGVSIQTKKVFMQ